ncbi:hypothetical protein Ssi03_42020 [Sphaerisporangium siamense]|uniref:Uncharacterized protein n=1 Tax=Sphaerisporangium siamense TaxID=795645 RepID=A0A7W7DFV9_9ACTN|nr:hypothetical protein [Sphaerisporangium siamense]MBB4704598.1 hypothetical protein [Sphaerisporangium siamense]GII86212.1 hypothetical protein Ssi03_42020 [Sphaerisporangium siamense]
MKMREEPWTPGPNDSPFGFTLLNPQGDRHLAFDDRRGHWYRLWRGRRPERLNGGDAILLRPSETGSILQISMVWIMNHPTETRRHALAEEVAAGAHAVVQHFARLSGAV